MRFRCAKCKSEKAAVDFPHAKGKRHSWCRECMNSYKRELRRRYRETNPRKKRIAEDYTTPNGEYICSRCKLAFPRNHYQAGRGGGWCKTCHKTVAEERRRRSGVPARNFTVIEGDRKLCAHCKTYRDLSEFYAATRGRGGRAAYCKACHLDKYYDRDVYREASYKHRKNNRETYLASHRVAQFKRRTRREVQSDGSLDRSALKNVYGEKMCHYCGLHVPRKERTLDHVIPLSKGGLHSISNVVMACKNCNSAKRDMDKEDFVDRIVKGLFK